MANVFIEESTLTAIADSIRAKTGTTDKIYPADMATAIEGITGGGGGTVEGYATVTFHYTDQEGEKEFSRLVMVGDDCPDPVTQGRIDTPTKESTVQYDYTFNGWATADGGSADSNALKNITGDKVLYSAFAESVRMYTISFYDGATLLHTEQVAYGGSSEYKYQKAELKFNGWTPEPTNITGDMDCYGEWIAKPSFATSSWETIKQISESGQAAENFSVGDERDITVTYADGTTEVVTLQIAGFNQMATDGAMDGFAFVPSATAGITMVAKYALDTTQRMYKSSSTTAETLYFYAVEAAYKGKTVICELYNWLHTDFLGALPPDFLSVLKPQVVFTKMDTSTWEQIVHRETVTIPSSIRITGVDLDNGNDYSNASQLALFEDANNRKKTTRAGTAVSYWVRDFSQNGLGYYNPCVVNASGVAEKSDLSSQNHIVPMFSV